MHNIEINDLSQNADLTAGEMSDVNGGIAPLPSPGPASRSVSTVSTSLGSPTGSILTTKTIIDPLFKTQ